MLPLFLSLPPAGRGNIDQFLVHESLGSGKVAKGLVRDEQWLTEQFRKNRSAKFFTILWNYATAQWDKGEEISTMMYARRSGKNPYEQEKNTWWQKLEPRGIF